MGLKQQRAERVRGWEAFHRWESRQPPRKVDSNTVIGDLGVIWARLPEEVRRRDPDPKKIGIRRRQTSVVILSRNR